MRTLLIASISSILFFGCARADILPGVVDSISPEVSVGTLGIGIDADARLTALPIGFRFGYSAFNYDFNHQFRQVPFRAKIDLSNGGLVADYYPFGSGFRLSGGFRINDNDVKLTGTTTSSVKIGNTTYTGSQVGQLDGRISFDKIAPYVGFGFSEQFLGGPTLSFDLGAMFQGSPRVDLTGSGTLAGSPQFASDVAAERAAIAHDVKDFNIYPVVQLALGWRF